MPSCHCSQICELAAPPVRPTVLRLRAYFQFNESFALLLHVRPGEGPTAGVEVAVHLAESAEGGEDCLVPAEADRHALEPPPGAPPSAGVDAFVQALITGGWTYWWRVSAHAQGCPWAGCASGCVGPARVGAEARRGEARWHSHPQGAVLPPMSGQGGKPALQKDGSSCGPGPAGLMPAMPAFMLPCPPCQNRQS